MRAAISETERDPSGILPETKSLSGSKSLRGESLLEPDGADSPTIETRLKEAEVRIMVLEELTLALSHALMQANQDIDKDLGTALAHAAERAAKSGDKEVERLLRMRATRFDR